MLKHPRARASSRQKALSSPAPHACFRCGFSAVVEVAHLRAVASYPPGTPPSVINHDSNLSILCPNCHKMLDRNMLDTLPPSVEDMCKKMHQARQGLTRRDATKPGPAYHHSGSTQAVKNRHRAMRWKGRLEAK